MAHPDPAMFNWKIARLMPSWPWFVGISDMQNLPAGSLEQDKFKYVWLIKAYDKFISDLYSRKIVTYDNDTFIKEADFYKKDAIVKLAELQCR